MIEMHKNVIRNLKKHWLHYVNNATSMQMVQISLIDEKIDFQIKGRNIILFHVYLENCLISTYLLCFSIRVH